MLILLLPQNGGGSFQYPQIDVRPSPQCKIQAVIRFQFTGTQA
jgi:hypothetical protein